LFSKETNENNEKTEIASALPKISTAMTKTADQKLKTADQKGTYSPHYISFAAVIWVDLGLSL